MYDLLKSLNSGSKRSIIIKKNIAGSFLVKGLNIVISLLLIPITLNILDPVKYGIWITIFSIVNWFNMMDIGIGNGFRNKFAESIALKDFKLAKNYIKILYLSTLIISFIILTVYAVIQPFLDWSLILNLPSNFDEDISKILLITIIFFSGQLFLKNILTILLALQKTALNNLLLLLSNSLALIFIVLFDAIGFNNLMFIAISYMISPIVIYLSATLVLFNGILKDYIPDVSKIDFKYLNDIMTLGVKFFVIQLTTIVMFTSANIIITQLYGPSEVTPYNISYRLFASTMVIFTIIIAPFWSAYTEAYTLKDFVWIKNSLKKLNQVFFIYVGLVLALLFVSPWIFNVWIGEQVIIPINLSICFAIYVCLLSWSGMFAQFLNGIGKVKIQLYIACYQCLTTIPMAIFFAKNLELGIPGVIIATNINLLISAIILPIQVKKLSNNKASGIWAL